MIKSRIRFEIFGSRASETLVRSTYEIVYMISATGIMRSQRCWVIGSVCRIFQQAHQKSNLNSAATHFGSAPAPGAAGDALVGGFVQRRGFHDSQVTPHSYSARGRT